MARIRQYGMYDDTTSGVYNPGIAPGEPAPGSYTPTPPTQQPPTTPPSTPAPTQTYALEGWNSTKLADQNNLDPKQLVGRVLQKYDPKLGLNQSGLLDDLNALGIGKFSANSDRLNVSNGISAWKGMNTWDSIRDQEGNAAWQFGVDNNLEPPPSTFGQVTIPGLNAPLSGGGGYGSGSGSYSKSNPNFEELQATLKSIYEDGGKFNQGIVDRRTESAREALARDQKSRNANNAAILASRGLIGDGPEAISYASSNYDLGSRYANEVSDIYANESENADKRMMQALSLATGMTIEQASQLIDQFRADTERQNVGNNFALGNRRIDLDALLGNQDFILGQGNLALGNMNAVNNYNLGLASNTLARDTFLANQNNTTFDQFMKILEPYLNGANISSQGHR